MATDGLDSSGIILSACFKSFIANKFFQPESFIRPPKPVKLLYADMNSNDLYVGQLLNNQSKRPIASIYQHDIKVPCTISCARIRSLDIPSSEGNRKPDNTECM